MIPALPSRAQIPPVVLGCGNFGGIGSAPAFFGKGETKEEAFTLMDADRQTGRRLGASQADTRTA